MSTLRVIITRFRLGFLFAAVVTTPVLPLPPKLKVHFRPARRSSNRGDRCSKHLDSKVVRRGRRVALLAFWEKHAVHLKESTSASAQDAKHSAAQDYGDRGRDLNSYTFLLQQRMGSPSTSGCSRSPSRVGSQPRVEVFTSTLHTVFMAFANRTTLTMGKTGFRRFGIECPGLIRPLSRSRK